ncbi:MAG: hypothetical protein RL757_1218 [Bacteroidota bacterium]|jgi:small-conductance mechanosensitive channel
MTEILSALATQFGNAIPKIMAAVTVALVGMIAAKAVSRLVERIFATIGIDRLAEKLQEIDIVSQYNINVKPSMVFAKMIYYLLMLFFLVGAVELLGMPAISDLIKNAINYVPNLITAVIVLVVGMLFANTIKGLVTTACKSLNIPSSKLIGNFVFYFIFITAAISALAQAKIDTEFIKNNLTVILGGGVGAFALGYGLASRDLMANFLASFYSKSKFAIGDYVSIEGVSGVIVEMDNSSLILETEDRHIVVPLSKLTKEKVEVMKNNLLKEKF